MAQTQTQRIDTALSQWRLNSRALTTTISFYFIVSEKSETCFSVSFFSTSSFCFLFCFVLFCCLFGILSRFLCLFVLSVDLSFCGAQTLAHRQTDRQTNEIEKMKIKIIEKINKNGLPQSVATAAVIRRLLNWVCEFFSLLLFVIGGCVVLFWSDGNVRIWLACRWVAKWPGHTQTLVHQTPEIDGDLAHTTKVLIPHDCDRP